MAVDRRKALIAEAIKNETAIFTSNDILTVAEIDIKEVNELLDKAKNNRNKLIDSFLKNQKQMN